MSPWIALVALPPLLALGAIASGSETGLYALSRLRVEAAARSGDRASRLIQVLLRDDVGVLITLIVAQNLALELLGHLAAEGLSSFEGLPAWAVELVAALVLTPIVFFLCDLLPKDLFRRRPHAMVRRCALPIAMLEVALAPLVLPLRLVARLLERAAGLPRRGLSISAGRDLVMRMFEEVGREGTLPPRVEDLARNVLRLRSIRLAGVMVPWKTVETLPLERPQAELYASVARSSFTRLPAVGQGVVRGYVHQLEVLGSADLVLEGGRLEDHLRPLESLPPGLSVDRALARLRQMGQRMALVGTPQEPLGLVTLKDLVETISGDLERW